MNLVGQNNNGGQGQPQLDITQTTKYRCSKCDNDKFEHKTMIQRASALLTGYPNDVFVPIDIYVCDSCNEVVSELMPRLGE